MVAAVFGVRVQSKATLSKYIDEVNVAEDARTYVSSDGPAYERKNAHKQRKHKNDD